MKNYIYHITSIMNAECYNHYTGCNIFNCTKWNMPTPEFYTYLLIISKLLLID